MDTPSLVIVGAPHFFSSTTLRPLGPRVALTASARVFMPRSRRRRASSLKAISFGIAWRSFTGKFGGDRLDGLPATADPRLRRTLSRRPREPQSQRSGGGTLMVRVPASCLALDQG